MPIATKEGDVRRADRLFDIIQLLRSARAPVTARTIADALEVVPRTIYRDIAALQAARVPIDGAAGVGYMLRSGYDLPPLMFDSDEIEAIVVGARLIAARGDMGLATAAANVLAKISTIMPPALASQMADVALSVPDCARPMVVAEPHGAAVRKAIRGALKVNITYMDGDGAPTNRTIWPLGLAYFVDVTLVASWCELRADFRSFRLDRVLSCTILAANFDAKSGALLDEYATTIAATDRATGRRD
ncbi:MAG: YafY family protein [Sphingopyxis sp.]